jgi:hypothetical protein
LVTVTHVAACLPKPCDDLSLRTAEGEGDYLDTLLGNECELGLKVVIVVPGLAERDAVAIRLRLETGGITLHGSAVDL